MGTYIKIIKCIKKICSKVRGIKKNRYVSEIGADTCARVMRSQKVDGHLKTCTLCLG